MTDWDIMDSLSIKQKKNIAHTMCSCKNKRIVWEAGVAYCFACGQEQPHLATTYKPLPVALDAPPIHVYEPLNRFIMLMDNFAYIREVVPIDVISSLLQCSLPQCISFYPLRIIGKTLALQYPSLIHRKFECYFRLNNFKVPVITPLQRKAIINDFKKFTDTYHVYTKGKCSCPSLNYCLYKLLQRNKVVFPLLSIVVPKTLKDYDVVYNTVF